MHKHVVWILSAMVLMSIFSGYASGKDVARNFENITVMDGLHPKVYALCQDDTGYLWFGTDNGMVRYDGYRYRHYALRQSDDLPQGRLRINALCKLPNGTIYVASDDGIYLYDRMSDRFSALESADGLHVKSLLADDGMLWVGTTTGLLCIDLGTGATVRYGHESGLPSEHVSSSAVVDGQLYFGSYNYIYRYEGGGKFDVMKLPYASRYPNNMVLAIAGNSRHRGTMWLGTEGGLVEFDIAGDSSRHYLDNNPVKSFHYDADGALWIGTDNGLYVMAADGTFSKYGHEVGNPHSIANNVVWSIYNDRTGNVWLGTDGGVSAMLANRAYGFRDIRDITGSTDGNDIMSMCRDGRGILWLGGFGGLIGYDTTNGGSIWLRADKGAESKRLSHNKVRDMHDDGSTLWIATDGGLNGYDYATGKVGRYVIEEPTHAYSSNWMYSVEEDGDGNLWLGTYDGGLFVIDKRRLSAGGTGTYVADRHYGRNADGSGGAFPGNIISAVLAAHGSLFVGIANAGAVMSDDGGETFDRLPQLDGIYVNAVGNDESGNMWLATDRGLMRFDVSVASAELVAANSNGTRFVSVYGNDVWFDSPEGVARIDAASGNRTNYLVSGYDLNCAAYDAETGKLLLGTTDGFVELDPSARDVGDTASELTITDLFLDNAPVRVGASYDGNTVLRSSLSAQHSVTLSHDQNTFSIAFSQFSFMLPVKARYAYRLAGLDDTWQVLDNADNKVTFIGVPAGKYRFEVYRLATDGSREGTAAALDIRVKPVWYRSGPAVAAYAFAAILLMCVVWLMLRARHRRSIERARQAEVVRFADMKLDFMSNIAHEFKTPLTLIINRVQSMQMQGGDAAGSAELGAIRRNVDRIHALINRMVELNGNNSEPLFVPTRTLAVDFVRACFEQFDKEFLRKNIDAHFDADEIPYAFMWDHPRMESVFTNIISNAVKFTPEGGRIAVSVKILEQDADILSIEVRVEDNGVGMAPDEIPNIFDKYYTARTNRGMNRNGTGIGLYLVRQFVEQHGGTVTLSSELGRGTVVSVVLSTEKRGTFVVQDSEDAAAVRLTESEWPYDRRPEVLFVEDSRDIRDFVREALSSDFDVVTAADGHEALSVLVAKLPDIIVTDLVMPEIDGLELCRRIRGNVRTALIPIIVLTGKSDRRTEINAFEFADAFISKPFNVNYLKSRIVQLLVKHENDRRKAAEQSIITPRQDVEPASSDERFLQRIMEIVEADISNPDLNASSLCDKSGYGSKQVYRKIKQLTGLTTVEFIRDIRLKKAALFLARNKLTVSEVMYMVGFTNNSYFAQCFKQKYGISPSEYAKNADEKVVGQ